MPRISTCSPGHQWSRNRQATSLFLITTGGFNAYYHDRAGSPRNRPTGSICVCPVLRDGSRCMGRRRHGEHRTLQHSRLRQWPHRHFPLPKRRLFLRAWLPRRRHAAVRAQLWKRLCVDGLRRWSPPRLLLRQRLVIVSPLCGCRALIGSESRDRSTSSNGWWSWRGAGGIALLLARNVAVTGEAFYGQVHYDVSVAGLSSSQTSASFGLSFGFSLFLY